MPPWAWTDVVKAGHTHMGRGGGLAHHQLIGPGGGVSGTGLILQYVALGALHSVLQPHNTGDSFTQLQLAATGWRCHSTEEPCLEVARLSPLMVDYAPPSTWPPSWAPRLLEQA